MASSIADGTTDEVVAAVVASGGAGKVVGEDAAVEVAAEFAFGGISVVATSILAAMCPRFHRNS